jgi:hypothetical protein
MADVPTPMTDVQWMIVDRHNHAMRHRVAIIAE